MAIINLEKRTTVNWDEFNDNTKSNDSKIFILGDLILDNSGCESLNLTVGKRWLNKNQYYAIPKDGIKVKPGDNIIIESSQEIAMPYNVFGIVFGVGANIFRGGFVSSGKIDPGFKGKLKIGYYNGSKGNIIFKEGDFLACCAFLTMEDCLQAPLQDYHSEPEAIIIQDQGVKKVLRWLSKNWYSTLALLISFATFLLKIFEK